jgi:hypothetical protein
VHFEPFGSFVPFDAIPYYGTIVKRRAEISDTRFNVPGAVSAESHVYVPVGTPDGTARSAITARWLTGLMFSTIGTMPGTKPWPVQDRSCPFGSCRTT